MSQVHKEEILGHRDKDTNEFLCFRCIREREDDDGWPLLLEEDLLLKDDTDEDYFYFCDCCGVEMRPVTEEFFSYYDNS